MRQTTIINNRYQTAEQLGAGSLAIVYRCHDTEKHGQDIAVKILLPELARDSRAISRIRRDYVHLQMLTSPSIVSVYDFFENDSHVGYSMELIEGGSLAEKLEAKASIPIVDVISILRGVCAGVQSIHDSKMIHRNIKPENLLLMRDGTVKIADFCCSGRCGALDSEEGCAATLDYIPPEYISSSEIDWRTDIYALGVLGFEMLVGQSPFMGNTVYETMTKRLESSPKPPSIIRRECPLALDAIILRAMHRKPEQRFQSASEMALELESVS